MNTSTSASQPVPTMNIPMVHPKPSKGRSNRHKALPVGNIRMRKRTQLPGFRSYAATYANEDHSRLGLAHKLIDLEGEEWMKEAAIQLIELGSLPQESFRCDVADFGCCVGLPIVPWKSNHTERDLKKPYFCFAALDGKQSAWTPYTHQLIHTDWRFIAACGIPTPSTRRELIKLVAFILFWDYNLYDPADFDRYPKGYVPKDIWDADERKAQPFIDYVMQICDEQCDRSLLDTPYSEITIDADEEVVA